MEVKMEKNSVVQLKQVRKVFKFRKYEFEILYHYYYDTKNNEEFTTTELDELNINQVYNQYRQETKIPFPDEIKSIREQYGVSALKMSKILGFGSNQYRKYEEGEIPSVSNGRMIETLKDPITFRDLFKRSDSIFATNERKRIEKNIEELIIKQADSNNQFYKFIFKAHSVYRTKTNGFISVNPEKIRQTIIFFLTNLTDVFETKLNKLLFYSDFLHYKKNGIGITGLEYQAITYGPVPLNYSTIYENLKGLQKEIIPMSNNCVGTKILTEELFDATLFTKDELEVLYQIADKFKMLKAGQISDISHTEEAWLKNKDDKSIIDYDYAFFLKQI